ncbi:MAG: hypothetical protein CL624_09565 [Arcobacter sp.]|nr:hypothetical protein [Arcobacter sp.]|tara:strand:- start:12607 stop:12984 length:378 start_codon:yes stop_codon:yes gene_type:complete
MDLLIKIFSIIYDLKKEKRRNGYFLEFNKKNSETSFHHIFKENKVIDPRIDLKRISMGISWGYNGAGPRQAALAILADYKNDEFALKNYEKFSSDIINGLKHNGDDFIKFTTIQDWVDNIYLESH